MVFLDVKPNLFARLADGDWYFFWLNSTQPWYLIPAIIGAMMWTRFSKDYSWISRYPMAMYIGIATGIAIPLEMANRIGLYVPVSVKLLERDIKYLNTQELEELFDGSL